MTDRIIRAPWSSDQVTALNAFQERGGMHPFTCGLEHGVAKVLIATEYGWRCPDDECDYRQDWAHAFMVERGHAAAAEKTPEEIVHEHVTTLHLIGEQLTGIESWMWEHLANVRDAARPAVAGQPDTHRPLRGDAVETWLKTQRDDRRDDDRGQWTVLDQLLDLYRLHADTNTPLAEQPDTQTREARVGRCSAVMLRVHHAPHGWEPQPGMDPVHCPGYPQPGKES